jgi:hypothetical protein
MTLEQFYRKLDHSSRGREDARYGRHDDKCGRSGITSGRFEKCRSMASRVMSTGRRWNGSWVGRWGRDTGLCIRAKTRRVSQKGTYSKVGSERTGRGEVSGCRWFSRSRRCAIWRSRCGIWRTDIPIYCSRTDTKNLRNLPVG